MGSVIKSQFADQSFNYIKALLIDIGKLKTVIIKVIVDIFFRPHATCIKRDGLPVAKVLR